MRCKSCGKKVGLFKMNNGLCPDCTQEIKREEAEKRAAAARAVQEAADREKALHEEVEKFYDLLARQIEDIEAETIQVDDTPVTGTEAAIRDIHARRSLCFEIKETVKKLYDYPADVVMKVILDHSTLESSGSYVQCYKSNTLSFWFLSDENAAQVISKFVKAVNKSGDDNWNKYFKLGNVFEERLKYERALAEIEPVELKRNEKEEYPGLKGSEMRPVAMSRLASNMDRDALGNFVAISIETQGSAQYVKISSLEAVRFLEWEPAERIILQFDVEQKNAVQFSSYIEALKEFIGGFMIVSYDTWKMYSAFYYNGYNLREGFSKRKYYDVSILAENYKTKVNGFYATDIDSLCEATDLRFSYMEKPAGADSMALGFLFHYYVDAYGR